MAPRALVVLPTETYRAADFVDAAGRLGIDLAIASEHRLPLLADDDQVVIDCADVESSAQAVADLAATTPIDAIIAADDGGVAIAARASELIGLDASPLRAVETTLDKARLRDALAAAEIPQPPYGVASDAETAVAHARRLGYPVVVKPRTRSASVGVVRADDDRQARAAFDVASRLQRADDRSTDVLVEGFVGGPEVSVEGLVVDGTLRVLTVFDKPDQPDGPTFEESIFVTPSSHPPGVLTELERTVAAAVRAIGLTAGPIHAEARLPDGRPTILEVAGRTIGGLCGRALTFGLTGFSLEALVLRAALSMPDRPDRRFGAASGVLMIPVPADGILRSVAGVDDAARVRGVGSIEITAHVGQYVAGPPEGDRYLGFVFARGDRPDAVADALREAHRRLEITIE